MTSTTVGGRPAGRVLVAHADGAADGPMARGLWRAGHDVVWTNSGREARRMAPVVRPDLLILDGALADGGGFEVCRQLRSDHLRTPIILLTAPDRTDERVLALRVGADDCLSRTSVLEELLMRVVVVLRRRPPRSRAPRP